MRAEGEWKAGKNKVFCLFFARWNLASPVVLAPPPLSLLLATMDVLAAAASSSVPSSSVPIPAPSADDRKSPDRDLHTPPPAAAAVPSRFTRLTEEQRWTVVVMHKQGSSQRHIAHTIGVHRNTVSAVIERYRATGSPASGGRKGRRRCTDAETDFAIELTARIDKFTSPRRIRTQLFLDASRRTVDRRLIEVGLLGRVARHRRDYSEAEVRDRLSFAGGYKDWTAEQWEKVLFSDEKTFYGLGNCGQVWVRRPAGEANALLPEYTVHKQAHPVKLGAWGCFSAEGLGYLKMYEENMDAALMRRTLDSELLPSARLFFREDPPEQWYFLHDNDKKFKSLLVKDWIFRHGITVLDFPAYSPDLNPIENLWHFIQERVDQRPAKNVAELETVIREEWIKYNDEHKDTIRHLAHSMVRRCKAVLDANGWHTNY